MDKFILFFKKFSLPFIFLILGLGILYVAISKDQTHQFYIAGFLILFGSVFSLINVTGKSSPTISWAIGGLSLILAAFAGYSSFVSVQDTQQHQADYKKSKLMAERNLQDLRTIETAYIKKYGTYAPNWDSLMVFINTDSVDIDDFEGSVPARRITVEELEFLASIKFKIFKDGDSILYKKTQAIDNKMTEEEAIALCKMDSIPKDLVGFRRDKKAMKFIEITFIKNQSYMKEREDNDLGEFVPENLMYIPMSNNNDIWDYNFKQFYDTDSNITSYIRIGGLLPFPKYQGGNFEEIFFGDTLSASLKGSWEDEK